MAYVECKIWLFQGDDDRHQETCYRAMKAGCTIDCIDISFQYEGKDRLVSGSDNAFNDFEVVTKPGKADLILGIPWLWIYEAKIDMWKKGITIYNDFVPFCKYPKNNEYYYSETDDSESDSSDSDYVPCKAPIDLEKKIRKVKATGFIIVKNIRQDRVVGMFDYPELCDYLGVRSNLGKSIKEFEKSMAELEEVIKLMKSDIKKPLPSDVTDPDLPYNPEKGSCKVPINPVWIISSKSEAQ
ncbi:hypothetical protein C1645_838118 [Glomus cerebriforme]|uniref:Uncharacterized protein n=1 Tax=Glomus cerebriforme TaxID=658196 RepID=A0A397S2W9_9GLOM|nr:hypothetical protein C1645_838118 [Glomus cerebriforme]